MKKLIYLFTLAVWMSRLTAAAATPGFTCNFESLTPGKLPETFTILDGNFAVKEAVGNKLMELPGAPLDTFGVLFGPSEASGLCVSARIRGIATGRRLPSFGIGLNGAGGYRLLVSPGRRALELFRGDELCVSVPQTWTPGVWTRLRLQLRKTGAGEFRLEGKTWPDGEAEPAAWPISLEEKSPLATGKASVWGLPLSTTPIQFDDLSVTPVRP